MNDKTTEIYDLLCDLNYPDGKTRSDYLKITGGIPNSTYSGTLVSYNSNNSHWRVTLPLTNYEFSYVGFKAFKPVELSGENPPTLFYCCSVANNSTKRIAFGYSNLTDGVESSPLNNVTDFEVWLYNPITQSELTITECGNYYMNLILELDYYYRK